MVETNFTIFQILITQLLLAIKQSQQQETCLNKNCPYILKPLPIFSWDDVKYNFTKIQIFTITYGSCNCQNAPWGGNLKLMKVLIPDDMQIPQDYNKIVQFPNITKSILSTEQLLPSNPNSIISAAHFPNYQDDSQYVRGGLFRDLNKWKNGIIRRNTNLSNPLNRLISIVLHFEILPQNEHRHLDPIFVNRVETILKAQVENDTKKVEDLLSNLVRKTGTHYCTTVHYGALRYADQYSHRDPIVWSDFYNLVQIRDSPSSWYPSVLIPSDGKFIDELVLHKSEFDYYERPVRQIVKNKWRDQIIDYYKVNTFRGCTVFAVRNFNFTANVNDGSCQFAVFASASPITRDTEANYLASLVSVLILMIMQLYAIT